jgi:hypothetical protein
MWGSFSQSRHDHNVLNKYRSQLRILEDAFLASKSPPCVLWGCELGAFPFTHLTLLSNCMIISKDVLPSDSEFERLSDDIKHVFVCTLGALSTWEKTLHSALSKLNNIHMVTIYTSEEREQGESLAPIDVYEYAAKALFTNLSMTLWPPKIFCKMVKIPK